MKSTIEFVRKYKWEQSTRRITTLHRFFDFSESGRITCSKMFGAGLSREIFIVKNGDIARYQVNEDWEKVVEDLILFINNPDSIKYAQEHMVSDSDLFIDWLRKNCQHSSLQNLSNDELANLLMTRHEKHLVLLGWQWFGFVGKYPIDKILHDRLKKYLISEDEIKTILLHKRPVSIVEEELFAKELALRIQKKELTGVDVEKELLTHIEKFGHIVVYDETNSPMSLEYIKKRVKEYVENDNLSDEIKKTRLQFTENEKKFRNLLSGYKFDKNDLNLINFASEYAHFMEIRNQYRAFAAVYSKDIFKIIGEKLNLSISELLCFTDYEIRDALLRKNLLSKEEANRRYEFSVAVSNKSDTSILTGKEAYEIENLVTRKFDISEFKGVTTKEGVVSGRVKIVVDIDYVKKIEDGDILVYPMTKPVFLLAMKKAVAIVTDEGGMLCHASVISRELNIPCIVGTKIATQVLKDGDLIEVDANNGIVRILK